WSASFRGRRGGEEFVARIRGHPCDASGEHVSQRGEVRHRRRLAAVERILDGGPPAAALNIDEAGYVSRSDLEAECVAFDRRAIDELLVRPHRVHGRELVSWYLWLRCGR